MSKYKLLLYKKEYLLLIVEAASEAEAIKKAYNDEYIDVFQDSEKLPDSNYIVEKIVEAK